MLPGMLWKQLTGLLAEVEPTHPGQLHTIEQQMAEQETCPRLLLCLTCLIFFTLVEREQTPLSLEHSGGVGSALAGEQRGPSSAVSYT